MADNIENLILEHLRAIRGTLSEHSERLNRIELRLATMEQTLGSLYALSGSDREMMSSIIRRIERIERRLELSDYAS
jgi:archaellum component FlaC